MAAVSWLVAARPIITLSFIGTLTLPIVETMTSTCLELGFAEP